MSSASATGMPVLTMATPVTSPERHAQPVPSMSVTPGEAAGWRSVAATALACPHVHQHLAGLRLKRAEIGGQARLTTGALQRGVSRSQAPARLGIGDEFRHRFRQNLARSPHQARGQLSI